jgi:DNA polymerase (family 10)
MKIENVFESIINKLIDDKIITEVLSKGKTKSLTLVQIKKDAPVRRVDFLYSPPSEYAFALLYFTGSKIFNTVVRQRALDLGYTLNEHGLSEIKSGVKGKKVDKDFPTEKSILNFLGLEYVKPEDRIDGRSLKFIKTEQEPGTSLKEEVKEKDEESPQKIKFVPKTKNKTLKKKTESEV